MEKEFIPYEQALALKELGFDEPCFRGFNSALSTEHTHDFEFGQCLSNSNYEKRRLHSTVCCTSPLYQQAFRWFREKYPELDFGVTKIYTGTNNYHYHINLQWEFFEGSHEEAELACLKKLIKIMNGILTVNSRTIPDVPITDTEEMVEGIKK